MSKSLVRVHGSRKSGDSEYDATVQEFVSKMGGAKVVLGAILRNQPNSESMLFDNSVKIIKRQDDEDFYRAM